MKKNCRICKIEKEPKEFYSIKSGKYGVRGTCKNCTNIKNNSFEGKTVRNLYNKNRRPIASTLKIKDYQKEYRKMNKPEAKIYKRKWYVDNRVEIRSKSREKKYGITREQFDKILLEQNGVCRICLKAETMKNGHNTIMSLAVDHNHETGKVRGLLCINCNQGIGKFKDNPVLLQRALEYLINKI